MGRVEIMTDISLWIKRKPVYQGMDMTPYDFKDARVIEETVAFSDSLQTTVI